MVSVKSLSGLGKFALEACFADQLRLWSATIAVHDCALEKPALNVQLPLT
jgi:hypothetical protein